MCCDVPTAALHTCADAPVRLPPRAMQKQPESPRLLECLRARNSHKSGMTDVTRSSHKSPLPLLSPGSYLGSPAVARVQYCCVVLQWPLVQADIFRLVVSKLREKAKHRQSELTGGASVPNPCSASLSPHFPMQRPRDPPPPPPPCEDQGSNL